MQICNIYIVIMSYLLDFKQIENALNRGKACICTEDPWAGSDAEILELAACDAESSVILLVLLASFNPSNSKQKRSYLCFNYCAF